MASVARQANADLRRRTTQPPPPPHHHDPPSLPDPKTTHPPCSPLPPFTTPWRLRSRNPSLASRLFTRLIELFLTSLAMILLPTLLQTLVHALSSIHDLMSRHARSPFDSTPWLQLSIGSLLLLAWHVCLIYLSYRHVSGEGETHSWARDVEDCTAWPRWKNIVLGGILHCVLVPAYLLCCLGVSALRLKARLDARDAPMMPAHAAVLDEVDGLR
ncbi:hypothetical protein BU26DRAFT_567949 [Trematosphaeria pertusa]|uniref:Uncharacterized protein n=1 Tax=Trematosphaeria pertusa TaxID=390896 RepID=A0A6A6I4W6_9PLEO|nr:uncharacterized protein BU26DRAFT_567949 [Trematosphaeria pertusa]KAF2245356.1 hypothetical protein BU26DRAFT_567949 [Trematosphaeria pertusa]